MRDFDSQGLANTTWAFAAVRHKDERLSKAFAAAAAVWHMRNFNSQGIANTIWAFATVGHTDERLLTAFWKVQ